MLHSTELIEESPERELQSESFSEAAACYWRERLVGLSPAVDLPLDRSRPFGQESEFASKADLYSGDFIEKLQTLSEAEGVTLFTTLATCFQLLLWRYSTQSDIVLGFSGPAFPEEIGSANEHRPLPLRTGFEGEPAFVELLRRVRDNLRTDKCHSWPAAPQSLTHILPDRDMQRDPLFRILLTAQSPGYSASDHLSLVLHAAERPAGLFLEVTFNTNQYPEVTISRMIGHLRTLAEGVAANPNDRVSVYPLLTHDERQTILWDWNDTRTPYPDRCVHELFEEQAARTPDDIAVVFGNHRLPYRELNARANRLAHYLRHLGTGPDQLVGICIDRSAELVAALLAILKSGAAYVPLDPQYPTDRLAFMLEDSALRVLVTETRLRGKFSDFKGHVVCIDSGIIADQDALNCSALAKPQHLAYVIYTSGSTGKPKGVAISHRALINFLISMRSAPGLCAADTLLAVTTISFDIAGLELYLPLIAGARLVVASREVAADGTRLMQLMRETSATVMQATPATWRLLLEAGWHGPSKLKILCGGEAMPPELVSQLLQRSSELWNMYGPTETTVWSTLSRITAAGTTITIGRPIANTDVYLLDSRQMPVPIGAAGEIYIGGHGVAQGYLHRPDLTADRFIQNPFRNSETEERIYRTGDLGRFLSDGNIECLGRIDNQVKIRGFRIELGEIELALHDYPGVRHNVVVAREDTAGDKRLVAYVVMAVTKPSSTDDFRTFLRVKLPEYMIPSHFVFLDALPLTPNGKVDRRALPDVATAYIPQKTSRVRAQNPTELELLSIWEHLLAVRELSVTDNFFEVGGHSLLVAQLLRRIEQKFHRRLSMAAILAAPTIQEQALALGVEHQLDQWPSAVLPVQPAGTKPPLFCFGFDAGPIFLPLSRRLGDDQPLYGVDPNLLDIGQVQSVSRLEDLATCLADQIVEVSPHGPYSLGGFCGGGLLAFETAHQLLSRGHAVHLVAMFEPHTSPGDQSSRAKAPRLKRLALSWKYHFLNFKILGVAGSIAYLRSRPRLSWRYLRGLPSRILTRFKHSAGSPVPSDVRTILTLAMEKHKARPLSVPVVLFQAVRREPGGEWEKAYWGRLAKNLQVHEVPGFSNWVSSLLGEPNVNNLGNKLSRLLPSTEQNNHAQHSAR